MRDDWNGRQTPENESHDVPAPGGQGGAVFEGHHDRADARLVARAIKERWVIPEKVKPAIMHRLAVMAIDTGPAVGRDGDPITLKDGSVKPKVSNRDAIAAAKAIIAADKINVDAAALEQPQQLDVKHTIEGASLIRAIQEHTERSRQMRGGRPAVITADYVQRIVHDQESGNGDDDAEKGDDVADDEIDGNGDGR